MSEARYNTILNQYLRQARLYCYYELKIARGDRFQFSRIETHQAEALPVLEAEGLVWKLSDEDSRKKPCDGFCTPPLPSYLVIVFKDAFYFVPYPQIAKMRLAGAKSITEPEARELSTKVVFLGN